MYLLIFFCEFILLSFLSHILSQSLTMFFHRITKSKTIAVFLLAILFFPGTLIHEIAHYLMARLLFVEAGNMKLLPVLQGDSVKLGSVLIGKSDWLRRILIGVAPFLFGCGLMVGLLYAAFSYYSVLPRWALIVFGYVIFEIGNTMFSSKKDLEGTIEFLLVAIGLFALLYVLGFRLPSSILQHIWTIQLPQPAHTIQLLLAVPLIIDIAIIVLLRFLLSVFR